MYKKILMLVLLVCLGDTMRLSRFYSISRGIEIFVASPNRPIIKN